MWLNDFFHTLFRDTLNWRSKYLKAFELSINSSKHADVIYWTAMHEVIGRPLMTREVRGNASLDYKCILYKSISSLH